MPSLSPQPEPDPDPEKRRSTRRRHPLANLWRIRAYLRPYAWHMTVMTLATMLAMAASIAIPLVIQAVVDGPVKDGDAAGLPLLGLAALGLGVAEAVLHFLRRWIQAEAALGMEASIRSSLYAHLQRLSVAFHSRWQSGQLLSRATSDLATIRRFLSFGAPFLLVSALTYVVVIVLLIRLHWPLGLLVAASGLPLFLSAKRFGANYLAVSRQQQDQQGDVATQVEETAHGMRTIKAFGRSREVYRRFDIRAVRLHDTAVRKAGLVARFWALLDLVPAVTLGVVLVAGAVAVNAGQMTLGGLVAFASLHLMLAWPIEAMGWILAIAQEAMTAADRLHEVFDTEPTVVDSPAAVALAPAAVKGRLRFENIGFTYPGADLPVLRSVDLEIAPGETMALVGVTGSGKSTLAALVPRLQDPTRGRITLDGHDLRDLTLDSLRRNVAMAFEEPTLFSMSVRENLTLGRPDASDADVAEALRVARAEFVRDLPWGLDTRIGEQGMSLSGGQRQRLALARAVVVKPKVLVLDDPLSSLDVHTEAQVEEALRRVLAGATALVVAHRPSTVALADRVALLEDGRITAVGRHSDLLASVPTYRAVLSAEAEEVSAR
ncbi:MAG: ATP-binding cassette domain-containing protein [Micromonosporaceae bacterium]|nr:ATP-binding cassette domain-containing protein [Micromonosporaceae bacterium]